MTTPPIPPALRARAVLAYQAAVRDMPADSYCPKRPGERRVDCEYCIGETAADAVLELMAVALAGARAEVVEPFEELFAGGPDTVCRTAWVEDPDAPECSAASIEHVQVPMADLRAAFAAARGTAADHTVVAPAPEPAGDPDLYESLAGPVRRLRELHAPDGADTPFCVECCHAHPCLTIRTLNGDT